VTVDCRIQQALLADAVEAGKITINPNGTYTWSRSVRAKGRISAYLAYGGSRSTTVTWKPLP
jgi:hypothetical protein